MGQLGPRKCSVCGIEVGPGRMTCGNQLCVRRYYRSWSLHKRRRIRSQSIDVTLQMETLRESWLSETAHLTDENNSPSN